MKYFFSIAAALGIAVALIAATWPHFHGTAAPSVAGHINLDAEGGAPPTATPYVAPTRPATPSVVSLPRVPKVQPGAKYLVLFVLDGAQPSYYNTPNIPHIHALMNHGAVFGNGMAGILESETPSGHATIASGSNPSQNGILSFAWAKRDNTAINLFDPTQITNGSMERILDEAPATDLATRIHQAYPGSKVAAVGGHKYYAQDAMGGPNADAIVYYTGLPNGDFAPVAVPGHMPPAAVLKAPGLTARKTSLPLGVEDGLTMKLVTSTQIHMRPRALLVNLPEFDWPLGHVDGASTDPAGVRLLMQNFDRDLGKFEQLLKREGVLDQTLFVLTSDHGFARVTHTVTNTTIEKAIVSAGTSIISDTFSTAAYVWVQHHAKAAAAAARVARLKNPYIQSVYFKQLTATGYHYVRASSARRFAVSGMERANQFLLNTFDGPNGPDVVTLFRENAASQPGGQASWKGNHGGAAWNSQHLLMVFSGAGVKSGVRSFAGTPLIDIAPTVLTLMGASPLGMQGVPLAEGMTKASAAAQSARQAQSKTLAPVIAALSAQSRAEVKAGR